MASQHQKGEKHNHQTMPVAAGQVAEKEEQVQVESHFLELAYTYIANNRNTLGLRNPRNELIPIDYREDNLGFKHIKFQQTVGSIPVWGSFIIVHINTSDVVYKITGQPYHGLQNFNTSPVLTKKEAMDIAVHADQHAPDEWQPSTAQLYIYPDEITTRLMYEVTIIKGFIRKFVIVDAKDGQLIKTLSGTHTFGR